MAITLSLEQTLNALRLVPQELVNAEIDRLLQYAVASLGNIAPNAPDAIHNQAAIQLVGYLYENPGAVTGRPTRLSGAEQTLAGYIGQSAPVQQQQQRILTQQSPTPAGVDPAEVLRLVREIVPGWALQPNPPMTGLPDLNEDGHNYTLFGRNSDVSEPVHFWAQPNYVPDTPGTQSGIGRVLTVTGEDDKDYAFRDLPAATAGADETARAAAAAAQLDADTVIGISPYFTAGETAARNLNVVIRHPVNAYRLANIMAVSVGGQPAVLVGYAANQIQQTVRAGLSAALLNNISSQLVAGNFIPVDIRLTQGRGGTVHFLRTIDVPVVAAAAAAASFTRTRIGRVLEGTSRGVFSKAPIANKLHEVELRNGGNYFRHIALPPSGDANVRTFYAQQTSVFSVDWNQGNTSFLVGGLPSGSVVTISELG